MLLAYNTNLHPAEDLEAITASCERFGGGVRAGLGWDLVGLDLRLGLQAIDQAVADPSLVDEMRRRLDAAGLQTTTINAFPLGLFQADVVKQGAYRPDWTDPRRQQATQSLIAIAERLAADDIITISTLPGTYAPWAPTSSMRRSFAVELGRWAAAAYRHAEDGGKRVVLCPEPEPWCLLENAAQTAAFWQQQLATDGVAAAAAALDGDQPAGEVAVCNHLDLCWDTCHSSLAFEDQAAAIGLVTAAGASPLKVQVSAAPQVRDPHRHPEAVAALAAMHEPRFLHQTAACAADGSRVKVADLDGIDGCLRSLPHAQWVRTHFHVPLDRRDLGRGVISTVDETLEGVRAARAHGARHLAVETYTWSILAASEADAVAGTIAELEWLAAQLSSDG